MLMRWLLENLSIGKPDLRLDDADVIIVIFTVYWLPFFFLNNINNKTTSLLPASLSLSLSVRAPKAVMMEVSVRWWVWKSARRNRSEGSFFPFEETSAQTGLREKEAVSQPPDFANPRSHLPP